MANNEHLEVVELHSPHHHRVLEQHAVLFPHPNVHLVRREESPTSVAILGSACSGYSVSYGGDLQELEAMLKRAHEAVQQLIAFKAAKV